MNIRKMQLSDYENIYSLWLSCKGMGLNNVDDSKAGIAGFLKRNPDSCFVAEENNKIIGAIMAGNDGRRGYIYHTAVAPTHRRMGIAAKLVNRAVTALSSLGIAKVALVAFKRNTEGNSFWESQGFNAREDLVYRDITLIGIARIDT